MYCKNCGKPLDNDSQFCLHCGTQVEAGVEAAAYASKDPATFQETAGDVAYAGGENKKKKVSKRGLVIGLTAALVVILAALIGIFLYGGAGRNLAKQLDLGNRYLEEMNYEEAVVAFTKAIEIDPMSVDAHLGLVETYIRMGEFELALEAAEKGYDLTGDERLKEKINMIESGDIFDSLGRVMKRTGYDESGNVAWWHTFTYNLKGQEASITAYNGVGGEIGRIDLTYDEEGHATNGYGFDGNGRLRLLKYIYENGLEVKIENYEDTEGNVLLFYTTYEYDANGRQIKINQYDADGILSNYTTIEYDENGQAVRSNDYGKVGDDLILLTYAISEFDGNGNCTKVEGYGADGTPHSYVAYEYDENGRLIKQEACGADGTLWEYHVYEYNADGTLRSGKHYDGQGNLMYEE